MPEGFALFLREWGAGSLLSAFVLALMLGLLETRWSVNKKIALIQASKDEALEREKHYRAANEKSQETIRIQAAQIGDLMEQARTTVALVGSIESSANASRTGRHRE